METLENIAKKLNALLESTYDAEKRFGKAAEDCEARSLALWFNERALDRRRFAKELQWEINVLGEEYKDNGTVKGDVQRTWMDIKTWFTGDDDEAMLNEVIKGESAALDQYRDVLEDREIPASISAMVAAQMAQIEYGLVLLKDLKDIEFERE